MKETRPRKPEEYHNYTIHELLDIHEKNAKAVLEHKKAGYTYEQTFKIQRCLNLIPFVRDKIAENDAEAAAMFTYRLCRAIQSAKLWDSSTQPKKDKVPWYDPIIEKLFEELPGEKRSRLWTRLKALYMGDVNEGRVPGGIFYYLDDKLHFDDGNKLRSISEATFFKAVSRYKKKHFPKK